MTIGWRCPRCGDRDAETLALYRDHDDARPAAHYRRVGPWCITCGSRAQFDLPAEERRQRLLADQPLHMHAQKS